MSKCYDNPEYDDLGRYIQNTWEQHSKIKQKYEAKVMKNIHILPTDKPSRLVKQKYDTIDRLCLADMATKRAQYKRFNIYITSSEEIKEGDWCLDIENEIVKYCEKKYNMLFHNICKKIILTTDQDLINDDVQAIDDEFLEWFVDHPSCEKVKTQLKLPWESSKDEYEIIIPKEEPEQHIKLINDNIEEFDKAIELFKQETLEEAAERYASGRCTPPAIMYKGLMNAVKFGAKWQMDKQDVFAVGFAEWSVARALGCDTFTINEDELNIYKKYIDTLNGN